MRNTLWRVSEAAYHGHFNNSDTNCTMVRGDTILWNIAGMGVSEAERVGELLIEREEEEGGEESREWTERF